MPIHTTTTSNTDIARSWLTQRLEGLQREAAVIHGRAQEIERLIGELNENLPAFRIPTVPTASPAPIEPPSERYKTRPEKYKERLDKSAYDTLRKAIMTVVRSSRTRGMRLHEIREALAERGITTHHNYISTYLSEEKKAGRIIHNMHTGQHRWAGEARLVAEPIQEDTPSDEPASAGRGGARLPGQYGPNRQTIRNVLRAATGGMTRATLHRECSARGAIMDQNLLGVTVMAERRLGNIRFDEPTHTYHWTGKDEPTQ